jgi:trigger factor
MQPIIEDLNQFTKQLTIEIPSSEIDRHYEEFYREIGPQIQLKGFRNGHVPKSVIAQKFGQEIISSISERLLYPKVVKALKNLEIEPATSPMVEKGLDIKEGQDLIVKVVFEVYPDIELPDFSTITIERPQLKVTEEQIEKKITYFRQQLVTVKQAEPDHIIAPGDLVTIDLKVPKGDEFVTLKEFDRPRPPENRGKSKKPPRRPDPKPDKSENWTRFEAGQEALVTNLGQSLLGHKTGDVYDLAGTFSPNFSLKSLANKEMIIKIEIIDISVQQLPESDDDFVADLNIPEILTLEDLKKVIRNSLDIENQQYLRKIFISQIYNKIDSTTTLDPIPPKLLELEIDRLIIDLRQRTQQKNTRELKDSAEIWLKNQDLRQRFRSSAIINLKFECVRNKLIKLNNIIVTHQETNDYIEQVSKYAEALPDKELYTSEYKEQLATQLRSNKVIDFILSNVNYVDLPENESIVEDVTTASTNQTAD